VLYCDLCSGFYTVKRKQTVAMTVAIMFYCRAEPAEPAPEVPKGTAPQFVVPIQPSKVFANIL